LYLDPPERVENSVRNAALAHRIRHMTGA
jgi:hypothetical protein